MVSVSQAAIDLIVAGLPNPEASRIFPSAVAGLFAAHLSETDEYRGCWVDDLSSVTIERDEAQRVVVLAYCNWSRSSRGQIYADPCMAKFGEEHDGFIPYELAFAARERATRQAGAHARYEPSADLTWQFHFEGVLPVSPNTSLERTREG